MSGLSLLHLASFAPGDGLSRLRGGFLDLRELFFFPTFCQFPVCLYCKYSGIRTHNWSTVLFRFAGAHICFALHICMATQAQETGHLLAHSAFNHLSTVLEGAAYSRVSQDVLISHTWVHPEDSDDRSSIARQFNYVCLHPLPCTDDVISRFTNANAQLRYDLGSTFHGTDAVTEMKHSVAVDSLYRQVKDKRQYQSISFPPSIRLVK